MRRLRAGRTALAAAAVALVLGGRPAAAEDPLDAVRRALEETERSMRALRDSIRATRIASGTRGAWAVSADGAVVAAGTPAGKIEVWTADGTQPAYVLSGHADIVDSLSFGPRAETLYSVGWDGVLHTWDLARRERVGTLGDPEKAGKPGAPAYLGASVSPDGRYLAAWRPALSAWDSQQRKWSPTLTDVTRSAAFLADSGRIVVATVGAVEMHDLGAPSRTGPAGRPEAAPPVWRLRGDHTGVDVESPLAGSKPRPPSAFGDALDTSAQVYDVPDLVVTLSLPSKGRAVLRAWNPATGARKWQRTLDVANARLLPARSAPLIPIEAKSAVRFHSPKDGALVRSVPLPNGPELGVLSPDASVGYGADRDGVLHRVALTPATPEPPK